MLVFIILIVIISFLVYFVDSVRDFFNPLFLFFQSHPIILLILAIGIIAMMIVSALLKEENKRTEYKTVFLSDFFNLTDKEQYLLIAAIYVLGNNTTYFSPHDMAIKGVETTSTYYKNLYDKGYFDKYQRGIYCVNPTMLERVLTQYINAIDYNSNLAKNSIFKKKGEKTIALYEQDKKTVRLNQKYAVPYINIAKYIENKKLLESRKFLTV